uniref:Uncharacterized protein n=1 Tax=Cacopsylla melanoneura TaxID=428564 RepID=A0A8D8SYW5_9HEMI
MTTVEDILVENVRNFKGIALAKLDIPEDSVKLSSSMPNSPTPTIFRFAQPNFMTEDTIALKKSSLLPPKQIKGATSVPNVNNNEERPSQGSNSGSTAAKSLGDLDLVSVLNTNLF